MKAVYFSPERFSDKNLQVGDKFEVSSGMGGSFRVTYVGKTSDGKLRFRNEDEEFRKMSPEFRYTPEQAAREVYVMWDELMSSVSLEKPFPRYGVMSGYLTGDARFNRMCATAAKHGLDYIITHTPNQCLAFALPPLEHIGNEVDMRDRDAYLTMLANVGYEGARGNWPDEKPAFFEMLSSEEWRSRCVEAKGDNSRLNRFHQLYFGGDQVSTPMPIAEVTNWKLAVRGEPLLTLKVEPNVFQFFVEPAGNDKKVTIHQVTDFSGTEIQKDFPNGSETGFVVTVPGTFTDEQAIDLAGRKTLEDYDKLKAEATYNMEARQPDAEENRGPEFDLESVVRRSMARTLHVDAWARMDEEAGASHAGKNLFEIAPPVTPSANYVATKLLGGYEALNRASIPVLIAAAKRADTAAGKTVGDPRTYAEHFGYYLAMQAVGSGVAWTDDHAPIELGGIAGHSRELVSPNIEFGYDAQDRSYLNDPARVVAIQNELDRAIEAGDVDATKTAIENGASARFRDSIALTVATNPVNPISTAIIRVLLSEGADPNAANGIPFERVIASPNDNPDAVKAFLAAGFQPEPHHLAAAVDLEKEGVVEALVAHGVSLDSARESVLHKSKLRRFDAFVESHAAKLSGSKRHNR